MRFWDTSAIIPLLVEEETTPKYIAEFQTDPHTLIWYGTAVEIESSINRRKRDGSLAADSEIQLRDRLRVLERSWMEILPGEAVRERALRLLRVHPLRAADAFQLAAALIACEERTRDFGFLANDQRLVEAAQAEGFTVT